MGVYFKNGRTEIFGKMKRTKMFFFTHSEIKNGFNGEILEAVFLPLEEEVKKEKHIFFVSPRFFPSFAHQFLIKLAKRYRVPLFDPVPFFMFELVQKVSQITPEWLLALVTYDVIKNKMTGKWSKIDKILNSHSIDEEMTLFVEGIIRNVRKIFAFSAPLLMENIRFAPSSSLPLTIEDLIDITGFVLEAVGTEDPIFKMKIAEVRKRFMNAVNYITGLFVMAVYYAFSHPEECNWWFEKKQMEKEDFTTIFFFLSFDDIPALFFEPNGEFEKEEFLQLIESIPNQKYSAEFLKEKFERVMERPRIHVPEELLYAENLLRMLDLSEERSRIAFSKKQK